MAAVRGRTLAETGGFLTPFMVTAAAPVGQPHILRMFGIPTTWPWASRAKWNAIILAPVAALLGRSRHGDLRGAAKGA